jgi:hypothetical protein
MTSSPAILPPSHPSSLTSSRSLLTSEEDDSLGSSSASSSHQMNSSTSLPNLIFTSSTCSPPFIRIKTLCHKEIVFPLTPRPGATTPLTVLDLKNDLISSLPSPHLISPHELLVISHAKSCPDDLILTPDLKTVHVLLRPPPSPSSVPSPSSSLLTVHVKINQEQQYHVLQFPLTMTVLQLKKHLHATSRVCPYTPFEQRAICSSPAPRLMRDHNFLGDYLLTSCNNTSHRTHSSSGTSSPPYTPFTIYITRTMNLKRDLTVHLTLPNQRRVSFPYQYDDSLYFIREILDRQFGLPLPREKESTLGLYLLHENREIDDEEETEEGMRLALDHSLFDYGICPPIKEVHLVMRNTSDATAAQSRLHLQLLPMIDNAVATAVSGGESGWIQMSNGGITLTLSPEILISSSSSSAPARSRKMKKTPVVVPTASASPASSPTVPTVTGSTGGRRAEGSQMFSGMKRGFLSSSPRSNSRSCKLKPSPPSSSSATSSSSSPSQTTSSPQTSSKKR